MNSPSIYDDLKNTDLGEKVEKLIEKNEKLLNHITVLEGDIEKLCKELMKMKRTEDNLKSNISSLYKTSKVEIERKDRMIAQLRQQLDDLLFKRYNINSSNKWSRKEHGPGESSTINKRKLEMVEPESNVNKKQKIEFEDDYCAKSNKLQGTLPTKAEHCQEMTRERKSNTRSYSKSPPKQEKSCRRYRSTDRRQSRSRSRGRYRNRSDTRSRERDSRNKKSDRNNHRFEDEKSDKYRSIDLREVLSSRKKQQENISHRDSRDKNCNAVIKEALTRISNKHERNANRGEINSNSKTSARKCKDNKASNEVIKTRNNGKKNHGTSLEKKYPVVTITEDKCSSPENNYGPRKESSSSIYSKRAINKKFITENNRALPVTALDTGKLQHDLTAQMFNDNVDQGNEVKNRANLETHHIQTAKESYLDKIAKAEDNLHFSTIHYTNNTPDAINFSDKTLNVNESTSESRLSECLQTSRNSITGILNTDIMNNTTEQNISVSHINSSRTSINASRRRRCVIKLIT